MIKLQHLAVFPCFTVYLAEAAAVRVPESAGLGPEGCPGSQGGAYTGDCAHSNCIFFPLFYETVRAHSPMFLSTLICCNPDQSDQVTGKRARQRRGCVIFDYQ